MTQKVVSVVVVSVVVVAPHDSEVDVEVEVEAVVEVEVRGTERKEKRGGTAVAWHKASKSLNGSSRCTIF